MNRYSLALLVLCACTSAPGAPAPDAAGVIACTPGLCGAGRVCVTDVAGFCGGARPPCEPLGDGGACPEHTVPASCDNGQPGCSPTCRAVGHHCVAVPPGCVPPRCQCLGTDPCSAGSCAAVEDGVVLCISA